MMNDDGTVTVSDGARMCLHTGTLTRSAPATLDGGLCYSAVCSRCGAWAENLYWPPTPGPTLFRDPDARSALHGLAGLLSKIFRKQDA
jgi:hypothetical protein